MRCWGCWPEGMWTGNVHGHRVHGYERPNYDAVLNELLTVCALPADSCCCVGCI